MTENQKIFCEGVAKLCEAANTPELFRPIIKIWSLYEADEGGEVANFNMENFLSTHLSNSLFGKRDEPTSISRIARTEDDMVKKNNAEPRRNAPTVLVARAADSRTARLYI